LIDNGISRYMKKHGIRQKEFAAQVGIPLNRIRTVISGRGVWKGWELLRMCRLTELAIMPADLGDKRMDKEVRDFINCIY